MHLGANKENDTPDLSHIATGDLLEQLVKGWYERAAMAERIADLDVPEGVKSALFENTASQDGRDHVSLIIESLAPSREREEMDDMASRILGAINWHDLGQVIDGTNKHARPAPGKSKDPKESWVYFIESKTSALIKIGYSIDPDQRFRAIRTMSPDHLEMIAVAPGTSDLEGELHEKFAHLREHGEWFKASEEIFQFIEETDGVTQLSKQKA